MKSGISRIDTTVRAAYYYGGVIASPLPDGVEHGSFAAVFRYGCGCRECQKRGSKARDRGWRPRA